jgi:PAS domain S-box-containing protein
MKRKLALFLIAIVGLTIMLALDRTYQVGLQSEFVIFLIWGLGGALLINILVIVNRVWARTDWLTRAVRERTVELQEGEKRYRTLVEQAGDGIFILSGGGRHVEEVNSSGEEMLGYESGELAGHSAARLFIGPRDGKSSLNFEELGPGDASSSHCLLRRKNGDALPADVNAKRLDDGRVLVVARDVSERLEAEQASRRLARFPSENPNPLLRVDAQGAILYANKAGSQLLADFNGGGGSQAPAFWHNLARSALDVGIRIPVDVMGGEQIFSFDVVPFVEEAYVNFYGRDITERKEAEGALRRREATLRAVSFSAQQFLRSGSWREQIRDVLARLGEAVDVSRVYIFENRVDDDGRLLARHQYEWTAVETTAEIENPDLAEMPYEASGFGRWQDILGQGGILHGPLEAFPLQEREFLAQQDILSSAVVPIFVGDVWWGFMGFDDCIRARDWSPAELEALRAAADTLGAAIQRQRSETQLRQSVARAEALVRTAARLNEQVDHRAVLDTICEEAVRVLEGPAAAIMLYDEEEEQFEIAADVGLPARFRQEAVPLPLHALRQYVGAADTPVVLTDVRALPPASLTQLLDRHDFRTVAVVELIYRDRLLGLLVTGSFGKTRSFDEEELHLLGGLADQAAQAIANANLFTTTRRLLRRTQQQLQQMQRIINAVPEGVVLLDGDPLQDLSVLEAPASVFKDGNRVV